MSEDKREFDAVEWAYDRHVRGDAELEEYYEELGVQADLAQQVYDIRNKLGLTREQLAELSGLTPQVIEDLEETDYDGNWAEAIAAINGAFHRWFTTVILPASKMTPDDYSVKVVNA